MIAERSWTFPVDRPARRLYFHPEVFTHPAKMHLGLLQRLIDLYTCPGDTLLDPMAGTGSLMLAAAQQRNVIVRDLETEYVELMQMSAPLVHRRGGLLSGRIDIDQADARIIECPSFDHIITSPPYGFETGKGITKERQARIIGEGWINKCQGLTAPVRTGGFRYPGGQNNAGNKSGRNYWKDMRQAYARWAELLPSGGQLILVLKNHYRRGRLIDVTGKTVEVVQEFDMHLVSTHQRLITNPSLWQRKRREQGLPIVDVEDVLVFVKGGEETSDDP